MTSLHSVKLGSRSPLAYFSSSWLSSKQLDQIGNRKYITLAENVISFISQLGFQKSREGCAQRDPLLTHSKPCEAVVGAPV